MCVRLYSVPVSRFLDRFDVAENKAMHRDRYATV